MLQNTLFTFTAIVVKDDIIKTDIGLNPSHPIFDGHFPGQPLLPGVCMLQIVKEVLEAYLQKTIRLIRGDDLKFLAMITPEPGKLIQVVLKIEPTDQLINVTGGLFDGANQLFKFKGLFMAIA